MAGPRRPSVTFSPDAILHSLEHQRSERQHCTHQRPHHTDGDDYGVCPECLGKHAYAGSAASTIVGSPVAAILARGQARHGSGQHHGAAAGMTLQAPSRTAVEPGLEDSSSSTASRRERLLRLRDTPWEDLTF